MWLCEYTFMALARVRASGVDHCRWSNVELYRRRHEFGICVRRIRDTARFVAGFILVSGRKTRCAGCPAPQQLRHVIISQA
jgi:hypothetical protein